MNWWQLPGPQRLVEKIIQDVRNGKNVVLYLPEWAPQNLENALKMRLTDYDWHPLIADASDAEWRDPVGVLVSRFIHDPQPGTRWDTSTLGMDENFAERLIWLDGLSSTQWAAWNPWIARYAQMIHQVTQTEEFFEPTTFIIAIQGESTRQTVTENEHLSHYKLTDYVDPLDMMLYTRSRLPEDRLTSLQQQTAVSVIACLALWDPAVADALVTETHYGSFEPFPILRQIASQRGWEPNGRMPEDEAWYRGVEERFQGQRQRHSAWLALCTDAREIQRRIWSGQVGSILPAIQERKNRILKQMEPQLTIPYEGDLGLVEHLLDLEIGHLQAQIKEKGLWVEPHLLDQIHLLHTARNKLCHSTPIPWEDLLGI